MKTVGNVLWFILFGLWEGLSCFILGAIRCVTLIFIPFGIAFFRIGKLTFFPFGKDVYTDFDEHPVGNVLFLILGGGALTAVGYAILGALLCVTIIGIPFGLQCFKLMKLCSSPFGAEVF